MNDLDVDIFQESPDLSPNGMSGARIHIHYLPRQGFHFTPTDRTAQAADRFENFISRVMHCPVDSPVSPEALVVACAIALELIRPNDLKEFLNQLNHAQQFGRSTYCSWKIDSQLHRRALSSFTLIARWKLDKAVDWSTATENCIPEVLKLYDFRGVPKAGQTLKAIFLDLQAWIYLQMPMPILSDYLGCMQASLLPDSAWQRRFHFQAPQCSAQEKRIRAELTEEDGIVMEVFLESTPTFSGMWYIEELGSLCKGLTGSTVALKDSHVWKELLLRFKSLSKSLKQAGPIEAMLTGWLIHVAQVGTLRKKNPRLSRLAVYISALLKRLYSALRELGCHPGAMDDKAWEKLFSELLAQDPANNTLRASLSSFHSYLCTTFGTAPIGWLRKSLEKAQRPRANCIWTHEIDRLPAAIDSSTVDLRLREQVKLWSLLLTSAPIRFGELKWIRHMDIVPFETHIQIHLANQAKVGSGKTKASDRLVFIKDPKAIQALQNWLSRPEFKGTSQSDSIFRDPDEPRKIYRLGKGYALLTRCLKEVTGCSDFSIHLCRHTFISMAIEGALYDMVEFHSINPILEVQVQSGHQSPETTWRTYFHLLEDIARFWHDRALRRLKLSYRAASWWSGESEVNLRQAMSRDRRRHAAFA